ncbi:MAG: hypothetical protein GMKNLPBB_02412 [Myxococcota bacterium]|nr:hypothetical protein [Myxococcota bacterium]
MPVDYNRIVNCLLFRTIWSKLALPALVFCVLAPAPAEAGVHFQQGDFRLSGGMGFSVSNQASQVSISLGGGYFVLDFLELGLDNTLTIESDFPLRYHLQTGLRVVPIDTENFAPFITGRFGRLFIFDQNYPDAWSVFGGGGAFIFFGSGVYFMLEILYGTYIVPANPIWSSDPFPVINGGIGFVF